MRNFEDTFSKEKPAGGLFVLYIKLYNNFLKWSGKVCDLNVMKQGHLPRKTLKANYTGIICILQY